VITKATKRGVLAPKTSNSEAKIYSRELVSKGKSESTREKLLHSAQKLFGERGYLSVGLMELPAPPSVSEFLWARRLKNFHPQTRLAMSLFSN
jgi:hypothetical protein